MTDETGGKPLILKLDPSAWTNQTLHIWGHDLTRESLTELLAAANECAEDLATAMDHEYADRDTYPSYYRKYERDMAPVRRLRAAVARVRGE